MSDTANRFTTIPTTPPPGWERETPRYRVARDELPGADRTSLPLLSLADWSARALAEAAAVEVVNFAAARARLYERGKAERK